MSFLLLENLKVAYGKNTVLEDFNLSINQGEFVSLLGPSGCGKTTTLRSIAGFVKAQKGKIMFKGQDFTDVPVHKKHFGFVFQNYALFPHLNVFDNVAFGLKMQKTAEAEIKKRVEKMIDLVGLNRKPETEFVADFVGFENFFDLFQAEEAFKTAKGELFKVSSADLNTNKDKFKASIRPNDIAITLAGGEQQANTISGEIKISTFLGEKYQYNVQTEYGEFVVNAATEKRIDNGKKVSLYFPEEKIILVRDE